MSNTAFALSPISARATSPTEADFEAIREAFVETARGRWFLEEYTKRNRNADTALVLDAVARIERTLAAQKELRAEEPQEQPAPDLTETIAAIKAIIIAARDSAEVALSGPSMDEALAPTRKCARVIREIAWGLRESGADGRICSLLDSQVDAINGACDRIPAGGFRDHVLEAFDRAAVQIEQLGSSEEQEAEIRQPEAAIVADDERSTPRETVEGTPNVSTSVSNDNNVTALGAAAEMSFPEDASSSDAPRDIAVDTQLTPARNTVPLAAVTQALSQPDTDVQSDAQEDTSASHMTAEVTASIAVSDAMPPEHAPSETVASEDLNAEIVTAEDLTLEASDEVALDESLFDLSNDATMEASSNGEANVEEQDTASANVIEPSTAIEGPTDITVETAAVEEEIQQTTLAPEPEVAASELEQTPAQSNSPGLTAQEITIVPQMVESLEAMADIAIEETASDEALSDQDRASETIAIVAQDQLSSDDAPQIAEMAGEPTEPTATVETFVAPASDAESDLKSNVASATPSEDVPSMVPDETSSVSAKTPLPDNMLGEAIAQTLYSAASMPIAVETTSASVTDHMMGLVADATPDAITPPVSLGASLIASGIVAKPETSRNDPLAAFRRMSHAERIAFFS